MNALHLEVVGLQQRKTTLSSYPFSQDQLSEAAVSTETGLLENGGTERKKMTWFHCVNKTIKMIQLNSKIYTNNTN